MIDINELRITPDHKRLIIDALISDDRYYDNVELDSIIIDTLDTYVQSGPSSKPVFTYTVSPEDNPVYAIPEYCNCNPVRDAEDDAYCFVEGQEYSRRHVRIALDFRDIIPGTSPSVFRETMFFVYFIATGTPAPDTPCGLDNYIKMAVVVDLLSIYNNAMAYLKELSNDCKIPRNFINFLLLEKAFELSIKTGNYDNAIKYWKMLAGNTDRGIVVNSHCGCHG